MRDLSNNLRRRSPDDACCYLLVSLRLRRQIRFDEAEAREIGDGPHLIVGCDGLGVAHAKQDFACGVNAHVMDSCADNMVARLDR